MQINSLFERIGDVNVQIQKKRRKNDYGGMWSAPINVFAQDIMNNGGNNMGNQGFNQGGNGNGWGQEQGWGKQQGWGQQQGWG